jgi:hypothetical protein
MDEEDRAEVMEMIHGVFRPVEMKIVSLADQTLAMMRDGLEEYEQQHKAQFLAIQDKCNEAFAKQFQTLKAMEANLEDLGSRLRDQKADVANQRNLISTLLLRLRGKDMQSLFVSAEPIQATIPGRGGMPDLSITYKLALAEDVLVYLHQCKIGASKDEAKAVVDLLEKHLVSWDVKEGEAAVPITRDNLRRVPYVVQQKLVDLITGYVFASQ